MLMSLVIDDYYERPLSTGLIVRALTTFVAIVVTWHVMRALIFYFRQQYPSKRQTVKRLLLTFLAGSLSSTLIFWLTGAIRHLLAYGTLANYHPENHGASITINKRTIALNLYGFDFVQAVTNFIFFQAIYETLFFIRDSSLNQKRLRQAEQEQEKLRTANLQSQLDALKQQVTPHFLFNSLNVLDSLIDDDPRQARVFLEQLSTVYRYLLRANDQHLTDLASELDFVRAYFHLLKTRYGAGIGLCITVDAGLLDCRVPPLTLQLLVENAVKHNIILPEQPLSVAIRTEGHQLIVQNNLQRRQTSILSNKVGLANIATKYRLLGQGDILIGEENGQFVVKLPLLAAEPHYSSGL
jgi:two-component system LytT family sensor kinase